MKQLVDFKEAYTILPHSKKFSVFEDFQTYQLLILRGVELSEASVKYVPNIYILDEGSVYLVEQETENLRH
ncbi:MAG: hypothetical protein R2827_06915 [Bdellovibrionales bacterium]